MCVIVAPFIAVLLRDPNFFKGQCIPCLHVYNGNDFLFAFGYYCIPIKRRIELLLSAPDLWALIVASLVSTAASSTALFLIDRLEGVPRSTPIICGLVLGGALLGGRGLARFFNTRPAQQEPDPRSHARRAILVGIDQFTATVIKLTDCQKPRTTRIVSVLDARTDTGGVRS